MAFSSGLLADALKSGRRVLPLAPAQAEQRGEAEGEQGAGRGLGDSSDTKA